MRRFVGRIFPAALAALTVSTAQAGPLTPGQPAGIRQAQVSSSFLTVSGVALVAAGAGYLFSSGLGGSTDSTIIAINGGGVTPPTNTSTSTTGTP
jgi:peptidoglycan/LPS O-acetylase OafA/YrhL